VLKTTTVKLALTLNAMLLIGISGLQAQVRMESLTVADGLSQGYVTAIIQDKKGFLWIGTYDGLNRYDGYELRHFKPKPFDPYSIQASQITALFEDANGFIWVGTTKGLFIFDPLKEQFSPFMASEELLSQNYIEAITGDKDNNVFVQVGLQTDKLSVVRLSPSAPQAPVKTYQIQQIQAPIHLLGLTNMMECIGDSMIFATNKMGQVFRYSYSKNIFEEFNVGLLPQSPFLDHSILWGKDHGYVFRWKLPNGRDSTLNCAHWPMVLKIGQERIFSWLNVTGTLLNIKDNKPISGELIRSESLIPPSFSDERFSIIAIEDKFTHKSTPWNPLAFADRKGILWLGTGGWGLRKINLLQITFGKVFDGKSISSLRELPNGRLWVREFNDATSILSMEDGKRLPIPRALCQEGRVIYELCATREKKYWTIGQSDTQNSENRLQLYDEITGSRTVFSENIPIMENVPEKIIEDQDGNVWIGAHYGTLFRCKAGKQQLERFTYATLIPEFALGNLRTTALSEHAGTLWIGTNYGVLRVDHANDAEPVFSLFQHDIQNTKSISINWVTCICPDPTDPNLLWLGTRGGGLNRLHIPSCTFSFWTEAPNELPDNVVYGILPDGFGNLWCSTNRGICRFSPKENTFTTYQETDGLTSTEFNTNSYLRTQDGQLWFGGVSGLNYFKPENIRAKKTAPAVTITGIKVRGVVRLPDLDGALSLSYAENNVLFEFAALDFSNPATNHFRHRLKGIDHDWVDDGVSHSVNYSALPPGRYVLEVQAATADSPWSEKPVVFILEIRAPWYRSWLAYIVYVLLAAAAVYGYSRYRIQVFKLRNNATFNQRESERLKAFEAIKNEFFANVAHELRTPLTVILGLANRISRGEKADSAPENARQIMRQGDQLLQLTNQVLDLARLESNQFQLQLTEGNIIGFIQQHVESLQPLANSKGLQLDIDIDPTALWTAYDPQLLQKVLNNLISNAVRYTQPDGKITVNVQKENAGEHLSISVSDNGEGIAAKDLPRVFDRFFQSSNAQGELGSSGIGLTLTRDLVQLMGGRIAVDSQLGKGATFTIFLPIKELDAPATAYASTAPAKAAGQTLTAQSSKKPMLLIVEDNPDVAAYLRLCLQPHFRLEMATDGAMGIQKAFELMPDLVLTDVAMPLKNGYEVTETLKNDVRSSHIPIVMLTAKVEHVDRMEGHRRGANAYLTKPFDESELVMVLHNLLHLQRQWKARYEGVLSGDKKLDLAEHSSVDQQVEDAFILQLQELFEANYTDDAFNLDWLCQLLNMSSSQLDRKLKVLIDQSPMQMLRTFRLQKARAILQAERHVSIKELCFRTGFKNPSHFSRLYSKEFGMPPSAG